MKIGKIKTTFIAYTLALSVVLSNTTVAAMDLVYDAKVHNYTADPISLMVNKKNIETVMPPIIIDDRTLVPARAVFEQLGADVLWISETKELFVTMNKDIVILKIDDVVAQVNGEIKIMEVPPKIINTVGGTGSTMIPVRFVAEALNLQVGWDGTNRIISVDNAIEIPNVEIPNVEIPNVEIPNVNIPNMSGDFVILKGDGSIKHDQITYPEIQSSHYGEVDITSVTSSGGNFQIKASGKISGVSYGIIQDPIRLYVDITNSTSKLQSTISVSGSSSVTGIRTAQQPNSVSRVVFDLTTGEDYNIYLSEDRTTLNVSFEPLIVEAITFEKSNGQDVININASSAFTPNITRLSNPDRLVMDIPTALSTIGTTGANVLGNFVSSIRTSQLDANTVRVEIYASQLENYEVSYNNSSTTVKLLQTTYNNIKYASSQLLLKKDANHHIDVNSIIHEDKYLEGYYKVTLPGDYTGLYGYGDYKIDDTYLNTIKIENNNGKTALTFNQKNIYAYTIQEDSENIYINILNPKEVYKRVVVIDPGHGGSKPGNTNNVYNGVVEKILNLEVGNKLYALLQADPDIKVYTTRTTDAHVENLDRVAVANHVADMFVSLHGNSLTNTSVSGVQVFYPDPADARGIISQKLSKILMTKITTLSVIPERGANQTLGYDLTVLKHTTVPAALVEMGFMTNLYDATKLSDPNCQQAIAQGVYEAIKEAFSTIIPAR